MALEKGEEASPFVEEGKALQATAKRAARPQDLLNMPELRQALLTAAGVSDKAASHLDEAGHAEAMQNLIDRFLEPAGEDFVQELIFHFLLTRGDSLGGKMRNIAGMWGERRVARGLIASLGIAGYPFMYQDRVTKRWLRARSAEPRLETRLRALRWTDGERHRALRFNLTVQIVRKNVDLCLFAAEEGVLTSRDTHFSRKKPDEYIALGELKSGIDPAGADEHWKTASTALQRIRDSFAERDLHPQTFFVGAAVEQAMAHEIYSQLERGLLSNAANLTVDEQLSSLCTWLVSL
jgi:hypothetical protein